MSDEYDGPRIGEVAKMSVLFGPEGSHVGLPAQNGAVLVTPDSVRQRQGGEWVEIEDVGARALYRTVAQYLAPHVDEVRNQQWGER
jgi:hypothetical protein